MLDVYCERAGAAGLWAEPLNAVTNLAFVVAAAVVGLRLLRSPGIKWLRNWDLWLLTLLLAAIGIGSGLWHTFATRWGLLADVVPITLFINLYLLTFGWRVLGLRGVRLLLLWLAYQAGSIGLLALVPADALNGSVGYLPALAFLVAFAIWLYRADQPLWRTVAVAAGLFVVSLTFRTLDSAFCAALPFGTHFLWHLLNAFLLFLLLDGLRRSGVAAPQVR
jgi:hypothetical protein